MGGQRPSGAGTPALWSNPPDEAPGGRRALTRERVVAEALVIIAADGAQSLSMRALAARLGVVPGALYRHVRGKEQLYTFVLDAVLREVDCRADPAAPWAVRVTALAGRLRAVLENHPGVAALLKVRDPLSPTSLDLAEAFLAPLLAAGLSGREAASAFRLIYDYTLGFALADQFAARSGRALTMAGRADRQSVVLLQDGAARSHLESGDTAAVKDYEPVSVPAAQHAVVVRQGRDGVFHVLVHGTANAVVGDV